MSLWQHSFIFRAALGYSVLRAPLGRGGGFGPRLTGLLVLETRGKRHSKALNKVDLLSTKCLLQ